MRKIRSEQTLSMPFFCVTDIKFQLLEQDEDKRLEDDYNVTIKNIFMSYDYELYVCTQSSSYITSLIFPSAFCLALQSPSSKRREMEMTKHVNHHKYAEKKRVLKIFFNANHAKGDLQVLKRHIKIFIFAAYYENVTGMSWKHTKAFCFFSSDWKVLKKISFWHIYQTFNLDLGFFVASMSNSDDDKILWLNQRYSVGNKGKSVQHSHNHWQ